MKKFGDALNDRQGSLGQLIHNPDLYQSLNRAAENVEIATHQLRPIMDNARVFSEIIAREPGFILRNAVNRRPWSKGYAPIRPEHYVKPLGWTRRPRQDSPFRLFSARPTQGARQ